MRLNKKKSGEEVKKQEKVGEKERPSESRSCSHFAIMYVTCFSLSACV